MFMDGKTSILTVIHDTTVLWQISCILDKLGYDNCAFTMAEDAWTFLHIGMQVDVIIMDADLGFRTGSDFAVRVVASPEFNDIPKIIISKPEEMRENAALFSRFSDVTVAATNIDASTLSEAINFSLLTKEVGMLVDLPQLLDKNA